jgi:hypothetical protein
MMVIFFAIKEENAQQQRDKTCANLIELIGQNCHCLVVDKTMNQKYDSRLSEFFSQPQYQTQTALFLANIIHNPQKFVIETSAPPEIPPGIVGRIPHEDRYVVKAGLVSHPTVVTDERSLLNAINDNHALLGLRAISPAEALELAKDT